MYALNLSTKNRILLVTYEQFAVLGQPLVATLLEENILNYFYINKQYVYDHFQNLSHLNPLDQQLMKYWMFFWKAKKMNKLQAVIE